MEEPSALSILMVSGACCSPGLAKHDQVLERNLQKALSDLGLAPEVRKVSLSVVLSGGGDLTPKQRDRVLALFHKYDVRFTPALLFGDDVRFAGSTPTLGQLKEALQDTGAV